MTRYLPDGTPIPSSVPTSLRREREHEKMFGIYRGVIVRAVYPDDPKNTTKDRMEYVVKVRGQEYPNAINIREAGGQYNYQERVRKGIEKSKSNKISKGTFDELVDGEHVFVAFLEGYGNSPLILGGSEHPLHSAYKKPKKEDGLFDIEEFNGVEFLIDKDSNYIIKQVGRKDPAGKVLNEAAVGAFIKMFGIGDIELNTHGTEGTADLRMKFNKETKKFELYAQDNKIIIDENGIIIEDKFTNKVEMKDGMVNVTVAGDANINVDGNTTVNSKDVTVNADGAATINATGDVTVSGDGKGTFKGTGGTDVGDGGSPTKVDGVTVALAGGGSPVARLGDMVVGTGNLGAPVVSQILQGSPKVTSG
jgi:hypothetical protein